MSVVVEAVEGIVDAVDKYVIQPIAEDPIGFIVTTAGYMAGGPLGAAAANTAVGMAQGEDFGEALKGGVITGATAWAGDAASQALGSTATFADDAATSAAANTADDVITQAVTSSADDAAVRAATGSADDAITQAATSSADDALARSAATTTDELARAASSATGDVIESAGKLGSSNSPTTDSFRYTEVPAFRQEPLSVNDPALSQPGYFKTDMPDLQGRSAQDVYDQITGGGTGGTSAASGSGGYNVADAVTKELGSYWDTATGALDDAVSWAASHPIATTAGAAVLGGVLAQGGDDEDEDNTDIDESKDAAEDRFNTRLQNLRVDRSVNFFDDPNAYLTYGETGGEHEFFTPTVYRDQGYADGGQVTQPPSKINPAFAFYKYGNVPDTVQRYNYGGYASGGKQGVGDGRSDHIEALLSPGEFVMDAETVSLLGNGSSEAGARRLEEMRKSIRKQKGGALSKGKFSPDAKSPLAYLGKRR